MGNREPALPVDSHIEVSGAETETLNGKFGIITNYDFKEKRFVITLSDGQEASLPLSNITKIQVNKALKQ